MGNRFYISLNLVLFFVVTFGAFSTTAYSQEKDAVLVAGDPPLTQSMVDKSVDFLSWVLEIEMSPEHRSMLQRDLVRAWRSKNQEEIKSTLDIVGMRDKLVQLNVSERNKVKAQMRGPILENLRTLPDDELSRVILSAYESARSKKSIISSPADSSNTSTRSGRRVGADGFTGIYVGIRNHITSPGVYSAERSYVVFLPDGHVYWTLPAEGLLYFDPAMAQRTDPDEWGTYKIVGNEIHVTIGNNLQRVFVREGKKLKLQKYESQFRVTDTYTYSPLATGDGLKLNGTYRRWAEAPGITFSADGRFRDEGITKNFGTMGRPDGTTYEPDGIGGTGTYLIEQNTLELRYSDGRIKRFAFTSLPENLEQRPIKSFTLNYETFELDQ